jgi:hypothetical protein
MHQRGNAREQRLSKENWELKRKMPWERRRTGSSEATVRSKECRKLRKKAVGARRRDRSYRVELYSRERS